MYELIVIGTSWGGLEAVSRLLDGLHDDVHQPIVVTQDHSVNRGKRAPLGSRASSSEDLPLQEIPAFLYGLCA